MDINGIHEIAPTLRADLHGRISRPTPPAVETPAFESSERLDQALASVPDVRPEVVERARQLISLVQYPPEETMRKLARLLAMEIQKNS